MTTITTTIATTSTVEPSITFIRLRVTGRRGSRSNYFTDGVRATQCPSRWSVSGRRARAGLVSNRHRTRPAQASQCETPKRRGARIRQNDLVGIACERLANHDLVGSTTREEDDVEVHAGVALHGQPRSCEGLAREVPGDLVPHHRAGVAAASRLRLLRNQLHRGDAAAAFRADLGELAKCRIGPSAGPVHDKRMSALPTTRHGSIVRRPPLLRSQVPGPGGL